MQRALLPRTMLPGRASQPRPSVVIPTLAPARMTLGAPPIIASRASMSLRPSLPAHATRPPRASRHPRSSLPLRASIAMQARTSMPAPLTRRSAPPPPSAPAPSATPEERAKRVNWLRDWSRQQCGISFSDEQSGVLEVRLESFCRDVNLSSDAVQARVHAGDRTLTRKLADAVSTNYTFFFREPESFEFLRTRILPSFAGVEPLRIWSAASSTGEEAHSIAVMLREELDAVRARILGTDLSERALRAAEQGLYRADTLGTMSADRRARWFAAAGVNQYKAHDDIRKMCTFRRLNLPQRPWPFEHRFHIIFLRNVLYYFEPDVRRQILEGCYEVIEPRGYLITSLTEPMTDMQTRWTAVGPAIFRRGAP